MPIVRLWPAILAARPAAPIRLSAVLALESLPFYMRGSLRSRDVTNLARILISPAIWEGVNLNLMPHFKII
jgi:hypothetical protein